MKGPQKSILSQAQEQVAPTPQADAAQSPSPTGAPPTPPPSPAGDTASNSGHTSAGETDERVAVLSLSMVGEIMAARQACRALFGREANLLVGQNIRVLLKGGLDNEVGHFLLKYQTGESAGGTSLLNVIALRKDGTEFPARVTTQTWSWDKNVAKKGDTSARNWTAIFRDLSEPPAAPSPTAAVPTQEIQEPSEPPPAPVAQPKLPKVRPPVAPSVRPPAAPTVSPTLSSPQSALPPEKVIEKRERPKSEPLAAGTPAPAQATAALEGVAVELSRRFEDQLAALRQEREELKSKLAAEQSVTTQFKRRVQELEGQPSKAPGDRGQAKGDKQGLFELQAQLDAAKEAAGFSEAALKEETARREKLEAQLHSASTSRSEPSQGLRSELSALRRERDELKRTVMVQQQAAAEATRRAQELESCSGDSSTEFERVKSELAGLTVARDRAQAELRQQLADAQAVNSSLEKSLGETLARHNNHEAELSKLRREHTELTSKLADQELAAAQAQLLTGDPKGRSNRGSADAKRASAELEKLNADRKRAEAQWREQLDAANNLKERIEASLFEALERLKAREQEAGRLRQERNDLQGRLTAEQQAAAQFKQRVDQFEAQSRKFTGDLDQAKVEAEKNERAHVELRAQLDAAKEAAGSTEAKLKEEVARRQKLEEQLQSLEGSQQQEQTERSQRFDKELGSLRQERDELRDQLQTLETRLKQEETERHERLDEELSGLRQEREELKRKLDVQQKAAAEATKRADELAARVSQDAAESERARNELSVKNSEREREKDDMRVELAGAHAARTRLESSLGEALERGNRFEAELQDLRRQQEDLNNKLASEQRATAEARRRAEQLEKEAAGTNEAALKKEIARREQLEQRLKTLSSGLKEEQAERKKRFDKELSSLRTERDALDAKLAAEQKEASESTRRAEEVERRLSQNAAEFERAKAELEQLSAERERSETALREQLDTAFIAKKELAGAWAGAVEQNKQLEEELTKLRREQEELHAKLSAEQEVAAHSRDRASDVESLLTRNATESERIREELEKQNAEMERMQAEWREQLEAAEAVKASLETSLDEARERNKHFEQEVAALQQERDGLQGKLAVELQSTAGSTLRVKETENRLQQSTAELERLNAELQQQRAKFEQSESNWRKQLEAAQSKKAESGKGAANELAALRREWEDLQAKLTAELQATEQSTRRANDAETRLNESETELERVSAELQQQRAKFEQSESNLRKQLETAQSKKAESGKGAANELAALRRERDDLQAKLTAESQAAEESTCRANEAQTRLNESEAELERVSAELQQQRAKFEQSESNLRKQLETAEAKKAESGKGAANELVALRRERNDLQAKLTAESQAAEESTCRANEAQTRLNESEAELERVSAELQQQRTLFEQSESKWRKQLESAQAKKTAKSSADDLAALRRERDELHAKLTAQVHAATESTRRAKEAESRIHQNEAELERVSAELKRQAANLEHAEAKWRRQSEAAQAQKSESQKILAAADDCNRRLEKELAELRLKYENLAEASESAPAPVAKPVPRVAPAETRAPQPPPRFERSQPEPQGSALDYPAQMQTYTFDFPKPQPQHVRRTRDSRESPRRRRQP